MYPAAQRDASTSASDDSSDGSVRHWRGCPTGSCGVEPDPSPTPCDGVDAVGSVPGGQLSGDVLSGSRTLLVYPKPHPDQ